LRSSPLSGTSGGAIGALLAWYGILLDGGETAVDRLERFWQEGFPRGGAALLIPDRLANAAFVTSLRLPVTAGVSPYATEQLLEMLPSPAQAQLRPWFDAQTGLRTVLEEYVEFDRLPELVANDCGRHELFVGAVEVLTGDFVAFRGTDPGFGVDAVVASGTLPELARATVTDSGPYAGVYWDGLYSQNPPISVFFDLGPDREDKPDEIWTIRINPRARSAEPTTLLDIIDRRNELAGNQSLEQELDRAQSINRLASAFAETRATLGQDAAILERFDSSPVAEMLSRFTTVALPGPLEMAASVSQRLDYASKFSREPAFLRMLIEHGQEQAQAFLARWREES
jgi:NTE family protein